MIGATLGHYRILEKLGEGGMGVVYRAQDLTLGREVALKLLPADLSGDDGATRRLRQEARHLSRISHANVETVYELGADGAHQYLVAELVTGRTLADRIQEGPLSDTDVVAFGSQIAAALAAVHACGLIHRDLKPSNIMITGGGQVKVLDFGLARRLPGVTSTESSLRTESGALAGTLAYMAPELLRGIEASPASDVYALGAVLHEMATGRPPHVAEVVATLVYRILNEPVTPPRAFRPRLSAGVEAVILRCLEKDPAARFSSAAEVGVALRGSARPPLRAATKPSAGGARRRWFSRRVTALVILATAGVLVVPQLGRWLRPHPKLVPNRVVVAPFENATGTPRLDVVGRMAADWIAQGLTRTGMLEVVQPATTLQLAGDAAAAPSGHPADVHLGEETGAATVVAGAYYLQGDSLVFQTRLTETTSGRLLASLDPVGTHPGTPLVAIEVLRRRVMAALAERLNPALAQWSSAVGRPPSYESYRAYVEGLEASVHGAWTQALQHYERAADTDTSYYYARISVGLAWLNLNQPARVDSVVRSLQPVRAQLSPLESRVLDWMGAWLRGDAEEAWRVAREMSVLAPASIWAYQRALSAMLINRPRETVEVLGAIDPARGVYRGWSPYWEALTSAHHMLRRYHDELDDARRGGRQYPDRISVVAARIRAEAALGNVREVETLTGRSRALPDESGWTDGALMLFAARELRAHGQLDASKRMAGAAISWYDARIGQARAAPADSAGRAAALYLAERWSDARAAFEALAASRPGQLHYVGYMGVASARLGDRRSALACAARLAQAAGEGRGAYTYWRADIAALLGDRDRALALLREARDEGHAIYFKMHSDPDLESLRADARFQDLLRPRG